MSRRAVTRPFSLIVMSLVFSACGGGGMVASPPQAATVAPPVQTSAGTSGASGANVQLSITLPSVATAATSRKPAYVSAGAAGISVSVYLSSDTAHASPVTTATTAIGAGAPGCGSTQPISCVVSIAVPPSAADDFVVTVYNAAPVAGTFPTSAAVLSVGSTTGKAITANAQNSLAMTVLGVPFSASLAFSSFSSPTVGTSETFPLIVSVVDASSQVIQGTFATPLVLTSTNPSITSFLVNGSPGTTIKAATDYVSIAYGGAASASSLSLTGTAPFSASQLSFSPSYVAPVVSPTSLSLLLNSRLSGTFTVSEPYNGGSYTEADNCGTNATVSPSTATAATSTFTVTAGLVPSFASCTVTIRDSIGQTVNVSITVTNLT